MSSQGDYAGTRAIRCIGVRRHGSNCRPDFRVIGIIGTQESRGVLL